MDGEISAFMGLLLALSGEWERGVAAADAAINLNPHFPGWYRLPPLFHAFYKADHRSAVSLALRINIPRYFWVPLTLAAAYGHLGELESARNALADLLAIRPEFGRQARAELGKWFLPDLVEQWIDGLRKAGLDVATPAS
jgi:tetratricopeptide (TPR) repeat protein